MMAINARNVSWSASKPQHTRKSVERNGSRSRVPCNRNTAVIQSDARRGWLQGARSALCGRTHVRVRGRILTSHHPVLADVHRTCDRSLARIQTALPCTQSVRPIARTRDRTNCARRHASVSGWLQTARNCAAPYPGERVEQPLTARKLRLLRGRGASVRLCIQSAAGAAARLGRAATQPAPHRGRSSLLPSLLERNRPAER